MYDPFAGMPGTYVRPPAKRKPTTTNGHRNPTCRGSARAFIAGRDDLTDVRSLMRVGNGK